VLPLWFQILLAIAGLGVPKALLDRYARWLSELARWTISIAVLVVFIAAANVYVERQNAPRHLNDADRARLKASFNPVKASFPKPIAIAASAGNGEAAGYAQEFIDEFNSFGMKAEGPATVFPQSANAIGIEIAVRDLSHPPQQAELFAERLVKAKFTVTGGNMKTLNPDAWIMVIGAHP
jgi:hypothetical protein